MMMNTYQKVNITIAAVLSVVLLLLFLGIITGVVQCPFQSQLGIPCSSCGISRDIINYLRLDFNNSINPHSLNIFIFFVGQIIARSILFISKKQISRNLILTDIMISSIWAIWIFGRLLF